MDLPSPFAISKYEVSISDWEACLITPGFCKVSPNLPHNLNDPNRARLPVVDVSWNEVNEQYIAWLNHRLSSAGVTAQRYRLPTEAEWEYVAAAGTSTAYWWGEEPDVERANFDPGNSSYRKRLLTVSELKPNPWGFYNIIGNAGELVATCYSTTTSSSKALATAATKCTDVVWKGGSYWHLASEATLASRHTLNAGQGSTRVGFRVMRLIGP